MTIDALNLDSLRPAFTDDPYPLLAELCEAAPAHPVEMMGLRAWLVTRYDDVRTLFGNSSLLSNDVRYANEQLHAHPFVQTIYSSPLSRHMLTTDPPDHTRLRRLVSREFTPRRIEALRPRIQQVTDDLVGRFAGRGTADLIDELGAPLPITIIMELAGVPVEDQRVVRHWIDVWMGVDEGDVERMPEMNAKLEAYLTDLVSRLKTQPAEEARQSLLGALAHAPEKERLDDVELASMANALVIAGYTTVIDLIGNGMLALLRNPDQLAALQADPSLLPGAVEEFLRYEGPIAIPVPRFAVTDLTLGDTVIPAGDMVLLSIASANRDPARFDRPDVLDVTRTERGHVGFGYGIHFCLGAPLARLEGEVALRTLLDTLPDIALAPGARPPWRVAPTLRGLQSLPVTFTPRPSG